MNIDVTQTPPNQVSVVTSPGVNLTLTTTVQEVAVGNFVPKQNLFIGTQNPGTTGPWLWIQTGLGSDGSGFTFWIEDGLL
jgi:hypothetical protein